MKTNKNQVEENLMDYRYLGRSGFRVPALSLGTATFGGKGAFFAPWGDTGREQATRLVDMCLVFGLHRFGSATQGASSRLYAQRSGPTLLARDSPTLRRRACPSVTAVRLPCVLSALHSRSSHLPSPL